MNDDPIRTNHHPFHEDHGSSSIIIAILCLIPMAMAPFTSVAITSWVALSILVLLVNSVVVVCEPLWSSVCQGDHTAAQLPFCDGSLSIKERVNDYVQRIPIPGQIAMMGNAADGYEPLGIPPYQWWSEGLHGALEPCVRYGTETKCPTSFPCPSGLGNTFNATLYWKIGEAIGKEGRAISVLRDHDMNIGDGLTYWSPNVNLQRDPRWGRNQEAPGEDPLLTSVYAKQFVQGLQGGLEEGLDKLQVAACCKHYVANSLENWMGHTRHNFDAQISEQDLYEYYMVPFRECVEAGAAGIMCSYNAINGVPACLHKHLLGDTLRDHWGFEGYLVTDCGALVDTFEGHGYTKDAEDASAQAKDATVDVNCGETFRKGLLTAFQNGEVEPLTITESFKRMATIQFRLGLFDGKQYDPVQAMNIVGSHRSLALDAARQSIVLLKNQEGVLPLNPTLKLVLIGPHIHGKAVFLSNYHGAVCDGQHNFDCMESPVETIQKMAQQNVTYIQGCHVADDKLDDIETAVAAAQQADRVILLMGLNTSVEQEGLDRLRTTLPGLQTKLVQEVLDVASEKTVLVLVHGGAVSLGSDVIARSGAIVSASYGGEMAAQALADVLFGLYNPTGKLSATMYPASFVDEIPLTEMSLTAGPGRTHIYYTGIPEFAFGHGLSFSEWDLEWHNALKGPMVLTSDQEVLRVGVNITNRGPLHGSQNVLLFWRPRDQQHRIREKLAGFQGTTLLEIDQSEILEFQVNLQLFELWHEAEEGGGGFRADNGMYDLEARGSNGVVIVHSVRIQVDNEPASI